MSLVAAFILPHPPIALHEIGNGRERGIADTLRGFREVSALIAAIRPETIVVTSPHATAYADYFHISPGFVAEGDMGQFGAPEVAIKRDYDREFAELLCEKCARDYLPAGMAGQRERALDHGTIVPLRFVEEQYTDYMLVRVGLSGLDAGSHFRLGKCIAAAAIGQRRRTVLIASGDLSHKLSADGPYGYSDYGPRFDRRVAEIITGGDVSEFLHIDRVLSGEAAECGLRSFQIMAGALDGLDYESCLYSLEGPFGVGYATSSFIVHGALPEPERRAALQNAYALQSAALPELPPPPEPVDLYVELARYSLETYVRTGKPAALPDGLPDELLERRAGAFVSLKLHGQLRGCIGTILPTQTSLADEIIANAISACSRDPRFTPVTAAELDDLEYSVDVLSPPEPIASPELLDVSRYGVIVTNGRRRGLLLPNLEGIDTVAEQLDIARRKAGIAPGEPVALERFEVVRHR